MADGVFNIAKGAAHQLASDNPNKLKLVLLKANQATATLVDHDNLSVLLAATGNTEANFSNYARKTGLTETITVDDTNDRVDIDTADQTWTSAGGATNNTLTKVLVCIETGAGTNDTTVIPLTHHDFAVTTDGSDLTVQFDANGFYRAS